MAGNFAQESVRRGRRDYEGGCEGGRESDSDDCRATRAAHAIACGRATDRAAAASRSPNFLVTLRASFTPDRREGTERAGERFSRRRMFGYRLRNVWKFLENSFQKCMECRAKDVNDERAANRRDWRVRVRACASLGSCYGGELRRPPPSINRSGEL